MIQSLSRASRFKTQYILLSKPGSWYITPKTLLISQVIRALAASLALLSQLWVDS